MRRGKDYVLPERLYEEIEIHDGYMGKDLESFKDHSAAANCVHSVLFSGFLRCSS